MARMKRAPKAIFHQKPMQMGGGMAQATALSALISLYLDSSIAATTEEIETFLSPLAPRSRIGEVVRGLAATRQLLTISLGTQSLLHIAGGLPEFPVIEAPAETPASETQPEPALPGPRERRPFVPRSTPGPVDAALRSIAGAVVVPPRLTVKPWALPGRKPLV